MIENKKELVTKSLVAVFVRVFGALASFLFSIVVARSLGASESGYFMLGLTVFTFVTTIARVGLDDALIRFSGPAHNENNDLMLKSILYSGLRMTFFSSSMFSICIYFCADFISQYILEKPEMAPVLKSLIPAFFVFPFVGVLAFSFQGREKIIQAISGLNIIHLGLTILLIKVIGTDSAITTARFLSISVLISFGILFLNWYVGLSDEESKVQKIDLWTVAKPLWIVAIMSQIVQWSGQFIAAIYVSSEEMAYLAVAHRVSILTTFVLIAINLVVAPKFSILFKESNIKGIKETSNFSVILLLVSGIPVLAVLLVFPEFILGFFGQEFLNAAPLLRVLALGQFTNILTGSVGYLLTMSGNEKDLRNVMLIVTPISIVLCFALTYKYGVMGSAVATATSIALQSFLRTYFVNLRLGFNTMLFWRK
ncbi:MATE family efflux transporter [Vibrio splendidus]